MKMGKKDTDSRTNMCVKHRTEAGEYKKKESGHYFKSTSRRKINMLIVAISTAIMGYSNSNSNGNGNSSHSHICTRIRVFGILFMRIMNVMTSLVTSANRRRAPFKKGTHTHARAWNGMEKACSQKHVRALGGTTATTVNLSLCKNTNNKSAQHSDDGINE